jgi:hypothetical protein
MKKGARKRKRKKTGKQASKRERYGLIFLAFLSLHVCRSGSNGA